MRMLHGEITKKSISKATEEIIALLDHGIANDRYEMPVPSEPEKSISATQVITLDALVSFAAKRAGTDELEIRRKARDIFQTKKLYKIKRRQFHQLCLYLINYGRSAH